MIDETHSEKSEEVEDEIKDYLGKEKDSLDVEDFSYRPAKKKKLAIIGIIIILILSIFAYLSYSKGQSSFSDKKVRVSIAVPDQIGSGDEISIEMNSENDNSVDLVGAKLEIHFPENFILKSSDKTLDQSGGAYFWDIGNIPAHGAKKIRIYGKVIGKMGEDKNFQGTLKYKPSNFNYTFDADGTKTTKISSVPIELDLNFPQSVKDSDEGEFVFSYKNKSNRDFGKVRLEIEFPDGFIFSEGDSGITKKSGEGNFFTLEGDNFSKGTGRVAKIKGMLQSKNDKETIKAKVYILEENNEMVDYVDGEKDVQVEKPEILISQTVNGYPDYVANKNEVLQYKIDFKNQSGKELRGLSLKSALDGNFDLASIKADKGTVNGNEIIWSALNVPELATLPAEGEASVTFNVNVKDIFPITKDADKNFILKNSVSISSFNGDGNSTSVENVITRNDMETKVKSFLFMDIKGYFNDDGRIQNGGALPPRVGQQTYYTIHWSVRNLFNDIENVRVTSVLPKGVKWTGKYIDSNGKTVTDAGAVDASSAQNAGAQNTATDQNGNQTPPKITEEKVFYDQATNEVVWEIPNMKANDGILTSAKEIVFQIEIDPQDENAGKTMDLMNNTIVSGNDIFTGQTVTNTGKNITTDLTGDDYSISDEEAIVKGR